jgi:high mobility group protein B2
MTSTQINHSLVHSPNEFTKDSTLPNALLEAISAYTDKRKKPKRNRSAFILFSIDIREKLKPKELDKLNPNDKFVRIAQLWKEISDSERKVYEQRAKEEKERYTNELTDFCKIFPSEPIQRPRNHIKKPCNAYGYYLKHIKESIRTEKPELRMCEVLRIVGERWKKLSPEEKIVFEERAEASRKIFKAEVSKQMEATKKIKLSNGASPVVQEKLKSPVSTTMEEDDLVCKDNNIPCYEVSPPRNPSLQRSTSTDKDRMMPDLSQLMRKSKQSSPVSEPVLSFSPPNRPLEMSGLNSLALNAYLLGLGDQQNNNKGGMGNGLESLYWKVEGLRRQILLQMQNVSTSQIPMFNPSSLSLLNHVNQVNHDVALKNMNLLSQNFALRGFADRPSLKKEDF